MDGRPLSQSEALASRLRELRRVADDLKVSAQRTGSGSVVMSRVFSEADYDIEVEDVGFNNRVVLLTFIPDDTSVNGLNIPYRMSFTKELSDDSIVDVFVQRLDPDQGGQRWLLYLSGSDAFPTDWVRLKFYSFANGGGTFSVELI